MKKNKPLKKDVMSARNLTCSVCGTARGVIHKYGLNICRRCFREVASSIGFEKYS